MIGGVSIDSPGFSSAIVGLAMPCLPPLAQTTQPLSAMVTLSYPRRFSSEASDAILCRRSSDDVSFLEQLQNQQMQPTAASVRVIKSLFRIVTFQSFQRLRLILVFGQSSWLYPPSSVRKILQLFPVWHSKITPSGL